LIPRLSFGSKHIITALPTVLTHVVTTSKETKDGKAYEGLKRLELKGGEERDRATLAREKADYLNENKEGAVYAGTVNGLLICLKTGDEDADGWYAWGGNARRNK